MKIYKTWEVLKMLEENHKLKFKNSYSCTAMLKKSNEVDHPDYLYRYITEAGSELSFAGILKNDEWELVQEPVTFMEAVNSEKMFKPEGKEYDYANLGYWACRFPTMLTIKVKELLNGKWYVKEDVK